MEIIVTNDDGWGSAGIRLLAKEMSKMGHVTVVAPDSPRSGSAAAISIGKPLYLRKVDERDLNGADVYTTNGTPADCVKMALELIMGENKKADLVVSGINHGSNVAVNLIYSGTMGACFCATEHGVPAIGFSIDSHAMDVDLHYFQPLITKLVEHLIDEGFPPMTCYNINAPVGPIDSSIHWTRQCAGHWQKEYEEHTDEKGEKYYLMVGTFFNEEPGAPDTDVWAIEHGYLSIQPVTIDMTAYNAL